MTLISLALGMLISDVEILRRAHAHNDYEHRRPLLDALDRGFCSVEADVHLVKGQLLVAHDRADVQRGRTLESLYLRPLAQRIARNGGVVFPGARAWFTLLVDIKADGEATYAVLKRQLAPYRGMLARWQFGKRTGGPVMVILSGDRPIETVRREKDRWVALDGRLADLDMPNFDPQLMPLVSDSWINTFSWLGPTPLPPEQEANLKKWVQTAREKKTKLRFWATPDNADIWSQLTLNGVNVIGTDQLDKFADFMKQASAKLVDEIPPD
jgi:glycerophosphoryl diester phosphodiesterase